MSEYLEYLELKEKGLRKVLTLNTVKCLECGEVLVSKSQHHYVQCQCPNETAQQWEYLE